jgi:tryptophan-rich sensory protein
VIDFALLGFVAVNVMAAMSGAFFKPGDWYERLDKPNWRPPNWLFPIAWTALYVMIAVSGWLVWESAPLTETWPALAVYGVQVVLNGCWSWIFFGMRRLDWALVELAALWASIVAMIVLFWPINQSAALLLLPYLAWVSFAGVLNYAVMRRNPDARFA